MTAVKEFDYLCRLCAIKMDVRMGLPIFETGEQMRNIDKKITTCLPLQISMSDQLPKVICEDCAFKVDEIFNFREKALQTENMLMQILQNSTKELTNSINEVNEQFEIEQKIPKEETDTKIDALCLDGSSGRLVDNQIIEIKKEEMHLQRDTSVTGENLTVDDHLTSVVPGLQMERQIIYCNNSIKFEEVTPDDLQDGLNQTSVVRKQHDYASCKTENGCNDPLDQVMNISIQSSGLSFSSQIDISQVVEVEYTKSEKYSLLKGILNKPTIDKLKSAWYTCTFCGEIFSKPNNIILHFERHFFNCQKCDSCFTNTGSLKIHKQDCFKDENNIEKQNDLCNNVPNDASKTNQGNRTKWTPKICPHCGKECRSNFWLQEHVRMHTGEKPYECRLCEKTFRSKIGLAQHTAKHGKYDYICATCGKGFQCKSSLILHLREHSDFKRYPCTKCDKTFKTILNLNDHENRHIVKSYKCKICGIGFINKGQCISHQKTHSEIDSIPPSPYLCEVCNKTFANKGNLKIHLRIHSGVEPHLCKVCGKIFLSLPEFKLHSTMHTGEKSFKCSLCTRVFSSNLALHSHKRSHIEVRSYQCEVCGETFSEFSPLAIHKRLHTGERPYECDICGKGFISKPIMLDHRKKHKTNKITNTDKKTTKEIGLKPIKLVSNNVPAEDVFILP